MRPDRFTHPGSMARAIFRLRLAAILGFAAAILLPNISLRAETAEAGPSFRVAFTSAMFSEVNNNDARASLKSWAALLVKDWKIPVGLDTQIITSVTALETALQSGTLDAVGMTTEEYAQVSRTVHFSHLFMGAAGGTTLQEYVLVVRRDNGLAQWKQLRGRAIRVASGTRAIYARQWIDNELAAIGEPDTASFFGEIATSPKPSQVILPVFFRQAAACVTTRRAFNALAELNPQIGHQLQIVASSPEVVPVVFCIRDGYRPELVEQVLSGLRDMHLTPAGRQVLTLFQAEQIQEQPVSALASAFAMLAPRSPRPVLPGPFDVARVAQPEPSP